MIKYLVKQSGRRGNAKWESDSLGNISHEKSIMVKELMVPEPDLFD